MCRSVSQGLRSLVVVVDLLAQVMPPGRQWVELMAQIVELGQLSLLLSARPREPAASPVTLLGKKLWSLSSFRVYIFQSPWR